MNLEACIDKCMLVKCYDDFCVSGFKTIRENESDDYFIYGNYDSDRTECLAGNMDTYKAKKYVCFAPKGSAFDRAYKFDSPKVIEQNGMFVTEEMVNEFFEEFQGEDEGDGLYLTVDLNSFDREFLLLLATMLFRSKRRVVIRFIYFSSGKIRPYDKIAWMELDHRKPEILLVSPGTPVFDNTDLILIAGYEIKTVKSLVDRFRPRKLILGYNKEGVNAEAHRINLETHKAGLKLLDRYSNNPEGSIKEFTCDVKNPVACCKDLNAEILKHCAPNSHIKLAATNTRLSLIGAALFAAQKNRTYNVQLVYASPVGFNEKTFSTGVTDYYEYTYDSSHLLLEFSEVSHEKD